MAAVQPLASPAPVAPVPQCTREEAEELTATIRHHGNITREAVIRAYQGRAWAALGYDAWAEYCREEFGTDRLSLPRPDRQKAVAELRDAGMSTRAIAAATGVSKDTVVRTLNSGVSNETPDEEPHEKRAGDDGSSGEGDAAPSSDGPHGHDVGRPEPEPAPMPRITGTDGKSYKAAQPAKADKLRGDDEALLKAAGEKIAEAKPELAERHVYREAAQAVRTAWKVLRDIDPAVAGAGCRTSIGGDHFLEKTQAVADWLGEFNRAAVRSGLRVVEGGER